MLHSCSAGLAHNIADCRGYADTMKKTARMHKRPQNAAHASSGKPAPLPRKPFSNTRPGYGVWAALAVITLAVFAPAIYFDFVNIDDPGYIVENAHLEPFPSTDVVRWAFTTGHMYNWHPLTWLSHAIDVSLYGRQAGGHHATSLLFHLINTILLFEVLRRMTGATWRSASVAALFAIHPIHVESVVWISERKDVLSTLFWMLTMIAYLGYARRGGWHRYLLVAAMLSLGLMAKPMLVTLPLVLLLLDYWPLGRITFSSPGVAVWRQVPRLVLEKVPLLGIATASCIVTYLVQRQGGAVMSFEYFSFGVRVKNAVFAYAAYLGKAIWPGRLAAFYPHAGDALPLSEVLLAAILLTAITIFAAVQARRRPYLIVGWLWYVGSLVPVIGLVQVGTQAMADRYSYLPLIGVFVAVTWSIAEAAGSPRFPKTALAVGACVLLAAAAAVAGIQVRHWRDSEALLRHTLRVTEDNAFAHYNLGVYLVGKGRVDEAETHFREALRIEPRYAAANNNLGSLLARRGRNEEGIPFFKKAIANNPGLAEAYGNLATAYIRLGRPEEVIAQLQRLIELRPGDPSDHYELANALLAVHKETEAIAAYQRALALNPGFWEARVNLGNAYLQTGQYGTAVTEYAKAIQLRPGEPLPYINMGYALASQHRWGPAAEALREAFRLDPNNAAVRDDLDKLESIHAAQSAGKLSDRMPDAGGDRKTRGTPGREQ